MATGDPSHGTSHEETRVAVQRLTACVGGILVFAAIFLFLDFFAVKMTEGLSGVVQFGGAIVCAIIGFIPARRSYVRSVAKKNPPRSWRIE
jgi:hypothetical protein